MKTVYLSVCLGAVMLCVGFMGLMYTMNTCHFEPIPASEANSLFGAGHWYAASQTGCGQKIIIGGMNQGTIGCSYVNSAWQSWIGSIVGGDETLTCYT